MKKMKAIMKKMKAIMKKMNVMVLLIISLGIIPYVHAQEMVTTFEMNGADAALYNDEDRGSDFLAGDKTYLEIRYLEDVRFRTSMVRFDVSEVSSTPDGAVLGFYPTSAGNMGADSLIFTIYGLTNESEDNWDEGALSYASAPGFESAANGNYAINDDLDSLTTITVYADSNDAYLYSKPSAELDAFISNDTNGLVTFAVVKTYTNNSDTYLMSSKEAGEMVAPRLVYQSQNGSPVLPNPNDPGSSQIIYVAPDGNDTTNTGTIDKPFESIQKAQELVSPGDTVYIRGGTYNVREDQISEVVSNLFASITYLDKSGTEGNRIKYWAYPGETPVFDFSDVKPADRRVVGIYVRGEYLHIKGLEMTGIQTTITEHTESYAIYSKGSYNIFEQLNLHDNVGTGLRHYDGGHNLFLNIDAYRNWDNVSQNGKGSNNDGIGVHPNSDGEGNVVRGCRVWFNSDDGIDVIRADAAVVIDSSWAFYNGYDTNFNSLGDGSGFKLGGHAHDEADRLPEVIPSHTIKFSIAARNKANGFYANHHLAGNYWYNNSAYINSTNFNMLNRPSREDNENIDIDGYDHVLINNLSYMKEILFRDITNIDTDKSTLETNSWQFNGTLSDADFESLDIDLLTSPRKEDGSLPDVDFMRPTEGSRVVNAGTDIGFDYEASAPDLGAIETDHTTVVKNEEEGSIPENLSLNQNYPNPFNPTTNIIYKVPNSGNVKITLYDSSGRKIKTLLNEMKNSGTYELQFEGSNLASGIYFYRLQMNGNSIVKKMILLK